MIDIDMRVNNIDMRVNSRSINIDIDVRVNNIDMRVSIVHVSTLT